MKSENNDTPESTPSKDSFQEKRQSVIDRRCGVDLRKAQARKEGATEEDIKKIVDRRKPTGPDAEFDRRRGPGVRRSVERKAAEEGEMTDEQFDFLMAIDRYKRANRKPFPSWTEVLEVVKALGYRKIAEPCTIDELKEQEEPAAV